MSRAIFFITLFFAVAVSVFAQSAQPSPAEKKAIANLSGEIAAAVMKKDRKALERVYAADFVHVHAKGSIDDRSKRLDQLLTGEQTIDMPAQFDLGFRKYGDTILAVGKVTAAGADGKPVTYAVTRVYVKEKDRWVYASSHASPVAPM